MPFKHHTETAYMLFLGLVICIVGFLIALLPALPEGGLYAGTLGIVTFFYPILLTRTFKENRADYEFRMMHWFPFMMVALWWIFQFIASKARILHILNLGFFFLWSLPLVALGIAFLILFAVHVIRRSRVRILFLSLFLALFTVGAVTSEAMGFDRIIQKHLYPKNPDLMQTAKGLMTDARSLLATLTGTAGTGGTSSSSDSSVSSSLSSSRPTLVTSSAQSTLAALQSSQKTSSSLSSLKPKKLPESGPETIAIIASTLLALYMGTVHGRARRRV